MVNDISRAFFHAEAKREVFVKLPPEDTNPGEEGLCGRLNYIMYGTRDAAHNWFEKYSQGLVNIGFKQGLAIPCVFYHEGRGIRIYVHGDDYVSAGTTANLKCLKTELEKKYQVKTQFPGPGEDQAKAIRILNRVIGWNGNEGASYEADPRHTEIIIDQLKFKDAKPVSTPGAKEEGRIQNGHESNLGETESSHYRAIVARCNYTAPDRPDIAYAVNELARHMASPTEGDWQRLERLGRYLKGKPRLEQVYEWQNEQTTLRIYSDADWAGCKETRKSTTDGCVKIGEHPIKGWSKTQSLIALSSGESELYATLKAAAEGLGIMAVLSDLGWRMRGEVWGDASAALGIIHRRGLGKTRHIDTGHLWVEEVAARERLKFKKVLGKDNPADLYTKYLDEKTIDHHLDTLQYRYQEGRSCEAPKSHAIATAEKIYEEDKSSSMCEWVNAVLNTVEEAWRKKQRKRCHNQAHATSHEECVELEAMLREGKRQLEETRRELERLYNHYGTTIIKSLPRDVSQESSTTLSTGVKAG